MMPQIKHKIRAAYRTFSFGRDCVVLSANQYPSHALGIKGRVSQSLSKERKPTGICATKETIELKTKNAERFPRN